MDNSILTKLLYNMVMLLAISAIYSILPAKALKNKSLTKIAIGCVIGLVGIGIMSNPFELFQGVVYDARSILISSAGLFFGPVPTVVATLVTSLFRLSEGGVGTISGIGMIVISAGLGLLWRFMRLKHILQNKRRRWIELGIFGIVVHIGILLCMALLPSEVGLIAIRNVSLPVMGLFPIGTVILGFLLLSQFDRQELQGMLTESEERYRSLFENDYFVMMLIDPQTGSIFDVNPAACSYYGWTREQMCTMNISQVNTLSVDDVKAEMDSAYSCNRRYFNFKHRHASGEVHDVEVFSGPISISGKKLLYSIVHDITKRKIAEKKLEESEERFRVTLFSVGDGVIATDEFGNITMVNKVGEQITGWNAKEKIGKPMKAFFKIMNEYTREKVEDPIQKVLDSGRIIGLANHTILVCEDGSEKPIADSAAPIKDENGNIRGVVLVIRDVTDEQKKQKEIFYLGYHDSLTGLYNRAFFEEYLQKLDVRANLPMSVIIGDVNGLKMTNDAFGHAMGDRLLKETAKAIKTACRSADIVARWGGDEFIALLCKTDENEAEKICENIKANCSEVDMDCIDFSISLGCDTKYNQEEEIETIIQKAEDYMYRKKSVESLSMRGNTIKTIMSTLHVISPRERLHSDRVSELCKNIGIHMGMPEREVSELGLSGLMHDIGKIAVSEAILNKKGNLSKDEYDEMKRHPEVGYRILSASSSMAYIADFVLAHHERLDGRGYPRGLREQDIPIQSRILSVADSYDAMTSNRPYRNALSVEAAIEELKKNAGTQFDPEVVHVLIDFLAGNKQGAQSVN